MGQLFETEKKPMNDADRIAIGGELAKQERLLIALKEEKANVNRTYRVRINDLEEKTDALSKQLADGVAEVKFEVEEVPDDARQMVVIQRMDTKTLITTRPFNEAEKEASRKRRQASLPGTDDVDGKHDTERPPAPVTSIRSRKNGRSSKKKS